MILRLLILMIDISEAIAVSKTTDIKDTFIRLLEESFKGKRKRRKLVRWIVDNSDAISRLISRGEFLRLKHGARSDIRDVLDSLKPCPVCSSFTYSVLFSDRDSYFEAEKEMEGAVELGRMRIIKKPSWYSERKDAIAGGGMFYECLKCGAVFIALLPEREFSGSIDRIG